MSFTDGYEMFQTWLTYVFVNIQRVLNLIGSNWLIACIVGLHLAYLTIIAVKLKRNTE